jgi:hypothetical protein
MWRRWLLALIVALLLGSCVYSVGPAALVLLGGHQVSASERETQAELAEKVDEFASLVVVRSVGEPGLSPDDLGRLAAASSLEVAAERSGGVLTAIWAEASERIAGLWAPIEVEECDTIRFQSLGTASAGFRVTHLADCTPVLDRLAAEQKSPSPRVS